MVALLAAVPMVVAPALARAASDFATTEAGAGSPDAESAFTARAASERQSEGIPALVVEDDLVAVARRHSATMASANSLHHNPELGQDVQEWVLLGENVGAGHTVDEVHTALMASAQHRSEILNPRFTGVVVGVVQAGDVLWVTQVFRQRAAPSPHPTTPPPPPAPSIAPVRVDAAPVAPVPPRSPARAPRAGPVTLTSAARITTSTTTPTTTSTTTATTTTTTASTPPAPPPEVTLDVVVAASTVPVGAALPAAGVVAAALLWMVVAGMARVTIRLQPPLA